MWYPGLKQAALLGSRPATPTRSSRSHTFTWHGAESKTSDRARARLALCRFGMLSTTFFCVGVPDSPLSKQQQATGPYLVLNSLFFFHTGRCGSAEQPESFLTWHPNRPCKACKIPQSGSACKCETKDNLLPIVRHHSHGQNPLRGEVRLRHRTSSNLRRACQPVRWGVRVPPAAPSFCCLPNPNPTPERNCTAGAVGRAGQI